MIFTLVFRSICSLHWLRWHKSILLAEILNFQGTSPTLDVGSFNKIYEIPREHQHEQAKKAHLDFDGRTLPDWDIE